MANVLDATICMMLVMALIAANAFVPKPAGGAQAAWETLVVLALIGCYGMSGIYLISILAWMVVKGRSSEVNSIFLLGPSANREASRKVLAVFHDVSTAMLPAELERRLASWQHDDVRALECAARALQSYGVSKDKTVMGGRKRLSWIDNAQQI